MAFRAGEDTPDAYAGAMIVAEMAYDIKRLRIIVESAWNSFAKVHSRVKQYWL